MATLGISVTRSKLNAVLVRGVRVVWSADAELVAGQSTAEAVANLLATLPKMRWRPPRIVVGMGTALSQVKPIVGLPAAKNTRMLTRILRENSESFFLRVGVGFLVSDIQQRSNGEVWAAAFDADVVEQTLVALRRRRLMRVTVVPSLVASCALYGPGTWLIVDDVIGLEVTSDAHGEVQAIRRVTSRDKSSASVPTPVSDLGAEYCDAYAAARSPRGIQFGWQPDPDPRHAQVVARLQVFAASILFLLCAAASVLAPGIRAQRMSARDSAELSSGRDAQIDAARVEAELARVSSQLERIDRFSIARGRMTLLLGAIAQALPESTAILTLRVDSLEGSFVAITPHAADILPQLASVDAMMGAKIVGSVTRESQGQGRLERATVRFRRRRDIPRAASIAPRPGS